MKIILTIINSISAIPILVYPFLLIAGVMSFDAPSSGKSLLAWTMFIVSVGYPLVIIALIFLSRRYDSVSLALLALIPLLSLLYIFFISGGTAQKDNYNNLTKDFVCDSNSFLSITGKGNPIGGIDLLEKKNFFTYTRNEIATIYKDKWMNPDKINSKDIRDKTDSLLTNCKNPHGKSPIEVFIPITDDQVKDILKKI